MSIVIDYTKGFFEAAPSGETVGDISGNATLDLSSGNVFSHTPTANTTFVFSNPPASGTAQGFTLKVTGANVTAGYDLANASYDSVSFSVAAQDTLPLGLTFNPNGLKLYIIGNSNDSVFQYTLSSAFDLSTASYDSVSFDLSSQDSAPTSVAFNLDGTKMFVAGIVGQNIYQYSLSTGFDISTASYDSVSFNVSSQVASPVDLVFNSNGTKMFVIDFVSDSVYQYSLSAAFDLSTASYDSLSFSVATQETSPTSIAFNPDGTKMFVAGTVNDSVYQYGLSTGFDISTASYDSVSFSVNSQDGEPRSIAFKSDGSKMYVVGSINDTIYQYSTGTSAPVTFNYPSSVDWPSGTAPDAPADGETDVLVFYTEDGGTTYYGFQAGDAMA